MDSLQGLPKSRGNLSPLGLVDGVPEGGVVNSPTLQIPADWQGCTLRPSLAPEVPINIGRQHKNFNSTTSLSFHSAYKQMKENNLVEVLRKISLGQRLGVQCGRALKMFFFIK